MTDLRTAAMRQAIDALRHGIAKMNHAGFAVECMPLHYAAGALRAALAAEPQPVADYRCTIRCAACGHKNYFTRAELESEEVERLRAALAESCDAERAMMWESGGGGGCRRALEAEAKCMALRKPLTDEQADTMWRAAYREDRYRLGAFDWYVTGLRDAERAHGIGGAP